MFEQAFKNIDDVLWKEAGCTTELDYTEQTSWLLFLKYLDGLEQDRADEAALGGKKYTYILDCDFIFLGGLRWLLACGSQTGGAPREVKVERAGLDRLTKSGENVKKVFLSQTLRWSVWDVKRFASAGEMPPWEKLAGKRGSKSGKVTTGILPKRQNRPRD